MTRAEPVPLANDPAAPSAARAISPVTARNALVVIAVIVVGAVLHWMGGIITPLLLAVFLAIMIDGFSRLIRRRVPAVPPNAAVGLAIGVSVAVFIVAAAVVAENASEFIVKLAAYAPRLQTLIGHLGVRAATRFGMRPPPTLSEMLNQFDPSQYLGVVAQTLQGFTSSAVLVLVYLGFMLASRRAFERKAVRLFHGRDERHEALKVFLHIRDGVERYLWIQTVTGAMIAGLSAALMLVIGVDNVFFWAFLIFSLNYIPIVGAAVGIILPSLFALLEFNGPMWGLLLFGGLFAITFLIGNIVLPRMQGDSLNLDPLVVLMSLGFWGAIWGLPGMFLSTPLTVLTMAVLAQFQGSLWIATLLSADGDPLGVGLAGAKARGQEPPLG